jgi:hypothetical protein
MMTTWRAVVVMITLTLTGCTHWRHVPPVSLAQHQVDLRACIGVARGLVPPVAVVPAPKSVALAVSSLTFAATVVEEFQFERRLEACLTARGYQRAGFTTNIYGWTGD